MALRFESFEASSLWSLALKRQVHGKGKVLPRILISLGITLIVAGILWHFGRKIGLGSLPGDISFRRGNVSFYFPLTTCLLISLLLSALFWLFRRWQRYCECRTMRVKDRRDFLKNIALLSLVTHWPIPLLGKNRKETSVPAELLQAKIISTAEVLLRAGLSVYKRYEYRRGLWQSGKNSMAHVRRKLLANYDLQS